MSDSLFAGLPDNLPKKKEEQNPQLPPELQGKSVAEVYEMLAQEHNKTVEQIKNEMKAQAYDGMQQKGDEQQKQQTSQYQPQSQQGYQYQYSPSQQQGQGEEDYDFLTNPDKFMDKQLQKRLAPIVQTTFQSLKETNKAQFVNNIGAEEWQKYGEEIEQFVNTLSPQVQVHPNAYKQAYKFVQSSHLDEIVSSKASQQASEKLQRTLLKLGIDPEKLQSLQNDDDEPVVEEKVSNIFSKFTGSRTPVSQPVKMSSPGEKKTKRLSEAERKMAQEFGMTEAEYSEYAALNTDLITALGGE